MVGILYDIYFFCRRVLCIKGHIFVLKKPSALEDNKIKVYQCSVCFKNMAIVDSVDIKPKSRSR